MPAFITFILKMQKKFTPKEKLADENLLRPLLEDNIVQLNQKVSYKNYLFSHIWKFSQLK